MPVSGTSGVSFARSRHILQEVSLKATAPPHIPKPQQCEIIRGKKRILHSPKLVELNNLFKQGQTNKVQAKEQLERFRNNHARDIQTPCCRGRNILASCRVRKTSSAWQHCCPESFCNNPESFCSKINIATFS